MQATTEINKLTLRIPCIYLLSNLLESIGTGGGERESNTSPDALPVLHIIIIHLVAKFYMSCAEKKIPKIHRKNMN
jgi:hypothetical protein